MTMMKLRMCIDYFVHDMTHQQMERNYPYSSERIGVMINEAMQEGYIKHRVTSELKLSDTFKSDFVPVQKLLGHKDCSLWETEEDLIMQMNGGYTIQSKMNTD